MPRKIGLLAVMLSLLLSACAAPAAPSPDDILSQKVPEPGRSPVTVLVKNAFTIHSFEKAAEQAFPQLDIIQVGNHTADMGIAEYEARLEHDDLPDMVMTWPLHVGDDQWEDQLLELSGLPCTALYNAARLDKTAKDGKLYYLPGPSQIRGIVYNKTLFREKGWTVPRDFDGFLALCQQIESSGIRALQLGLGNAEVLDTAFVGYSLEDCFSAPDDAQWLNDYNNGKGHFADHFAPALDTFQTLIDHGVLRPKDLQMTYADRENMIFTRQCAMVEDSVLLARRGPSFNGCTDEFGLMPFFDPGTDSDWARLYPVCYIGLNKHLAEPANKAKYELVLRLLDYISTPAGQAALAGDTGAMYSSLTGVPPPDVPEIADISAALAGGRCTVFPVLKNAQAALRDGLAGMVEGRLTAAQVAAAVDAQNAHPAVPPPLPILGTATADFTQIETGSFVTDAMRAESGCEIALFLDNGKDGSTNGKGIGAKLYQGKVTTVDLSRILPDYRQNERGELWKVTMTGKDLLRTLEYAVPVENDHAGWFYYFSGLRMDFAPAAPPGKRIAAITTDEGEDIDPDRLYSVAVMDASVPEDAIASLEKTGVLIRDILKTALAADPISPVKDGRFTLLPPP
ncbi:MAG: extracellular solute-binding protein [Oscillospiraceae bacterium]